MFPTQPKEEQAHQHNHIKEAPLLTQETHDLPHIHNPLKEPQQQEQQTIINQQELPTINPEQ